MALAFIVCFLCAGPLLSVLQNPTRLIALTAPKRKYSMNEAHFQ